MSKTRRKYTAEFKEEAIRLYEASDKSLTCTTKPSSLTRH